jgi:hypothetical protein
MKKGQDGLRGREIAARSRVVGFGRTPSGHVEVPVPAGRRCGLGVQVCEAALTPHEAMHVGVGRSSRAKAVDAKAGRGSVVLAGGDFAEKKARELRIKLWRRRWWLGG